MTRPIRRRPRWRPSRIDFATWAVCSLWDVLGRTMAVLQDMRTRRRTRRVAPVWLGGSKPA